VGRARDLVTAPGGGTQTDEVRIDIEVDDTSATIRAISATPDVADLDALIGAPVGGGLRKALVASLPAEGQRRSLAHLLLDDLPGASLVSGYARLRNTPIPHTGGLVADLCAGWQAGGGMLRSADETGFIPVPLGPPAPTLERADDPLSWHALDELPVDGMRRRRRPDLWPDGGGPLRFDVHFRDSHVSEEGETVLHEYSLHGTVDRAERRVLEVEARAHVLPWAECPGALASVSAIRGLPLDEINTVVRRECVGTTSCTHLNDTLRSLGDLDALLDRLG
jgi:hypothetical protein